VCIYTCIRAYYNILLLLLLLYVYERTTRRPSEKRKGYWPRSYFFKFTAATDIITNIIYYIGARTLYIYYVVRVR
jgi:hypothetical protein